jgi:hypothetical protein
MLKELASWSCTAWKFETRAGEESCRGSIKVPRGGIAKYCEGLSLQALFAGFCVI